MLPFKAECCYFAVKKRYSGYGSGFEPKFFVKYKFIGSGTKCQYIFILFGGLDSRFLLPNEALFLCSIQMFISSKVKKASENKK